MSRLCLEVCGRLKSQIPLQADVAAKVAHSDALAQAHIPKGRFDSGNARDDSSNHAMSSVVQPASWSFLLQVRAYCGAVDASRALDCNLALQHVRVGEGLVGRRVGCILVGVPGNGAFDLPGLLP